MQPVSDISEVYEAIQRAKIHATAFQTNLFPMQGKLRSWISHGELFCEVHDGWALFFRKDRDFFHLYFCAANENTLRASLQGCLRSQRFSVDIVGTEAAVGSIVSVFKSVGFRPYARLRRMVLLVEDGSKKLNALANGIGFACLSDCDALGDLLSRSFDRLAEQLPTDYELTAAVEAQQILVFKREETVGGLLFFETQGLTSTIRYWLISEGFRNQGLGAKLMRAFLSTHPSARRFVLWVIDDNTDAIDKYQHYGFASDGLIDQVLLN